MMEMREHVWRGIMGIINGSVLEIPDSQHGELFYGKLNSYLTFQSALINSILIDPLDFHKKISV